MRRPFSALSMPRPVPGELAPGPERDSDVHDALDTILALTRDRQVSKAKAMALEKRRSRNVEAASIDGKAVRINMRHVIGRRGLRPALIGRSRGRRRRPRGWR